MRPLLRLSVAALVFATLSASASAQEVRGVVLDQTELPLPGATVELFDGATLVTSLTTEADGTFLIDAAMAGDTVAASLDGFETTRVPRREAARITLNIAHTVESTTVVAPAVAASSPTENLLGNTLSATNVARLPSSRMRARESLPLLPSIVRGPDGLIQLGGARAHETPLVLDGFNISDPATGLSSINLPFEAVRGVDVLRDPMAITYGNLLAGMVKMESTPGGDQFAMGVQGVVPRPRLSTPGFGRIEGVFPRVYAGGANANKNVRYFGAAEYDYERIPVPEVTHDGDPLIVEQSATIFGRVDARLSERNAVTLEGLAFHSTTRSAGLGPRRDESATVDLSGNDLFAGLTHRFVASGTSVFTLRVGALAHDSTLAPQGAGVSLLAPDGWRGRWFVAVNRQAVRYNALATWERIAVIGGRAHDFTLSGEVAMRRLRGTVTEGPIVVSNAVGQTVRTVESGPSSRIGAADRPLGLALRDVWHVNERTDVDAGVRLDHSRHGGAAPSGRLGIRYGLDESGRTVLKAGVGSFVGSLPLGAAAFGGYPTRVDRRFDPISGRMTDETIMQPTVGGLRLPHAVAVTAGIERQLLPRLDAQVALTRRDSTRLATLLVPNESGPLLVNSSGYGDYQEAQFSVRRTWDRDQQVFASYVRSAAHGDVNDFAVLFQALDTPLVQPGGMARLASNARDRVVLWGTFNAPARVVVSPVTEWRSGFPYSVLSDRYLYLGVPNTASFPSFFSTDLVVYKTFTVGRRSANLGVQVFNLVNHVNPRDVYPVVNAPRFGQFANSVGRILRGYMLLAW